MSTELANLQAQLSRRTGALQDGEAEAQLRLRYAAEFDRLTQCGTQLRNDQFERLLLRPPWTSARPESSIPEPSWGVAANRAALYQRRPEAAPLIR